MPTPYIVPPASSLTHAAIPPSSRAMRVAWPSAGLKNVGDGSQSVSDSTTVAALQAPWQQLLLARRARAFNIAATASNTSGRHSSTSRFRKIDTKSAVDRWSNSFRRLSMSLLMTLCRGA